MRYALALAAAMAATGASAQSALDGYYVGAFVATSEYEGGGPDLDGQRLGIAFGSNNVNASGLYTGFEFSASVSNADGSDLIDGFNVDLEEDYEIVAALRLGYAISPRAALYGKLSARTASWTATGSAFGVTVEDDGSDSTFGVGFGGEYALGNGFGVTLEYDRYDYESGGLGDREGSSVTLGIRRGF